MNSYFKIITNYVFSLFFSSQVGIARFLHLQWSHSTDAEASGSADACITIELFKKKKTQRSEKPMSQSLW